MQPNYGLYTEEEAHAELIHSEALLLQACLTTLDGDEVSGLLRASLRVKSSFDCYRYRIYLLGLALLHKYKLLSNMYSKNIPNLYIL